MSRSEDINGRVIELMWLLLCLLLLLLLLCCSFAGRDQQNYSKKGHARAAIENENSKKFLHWNSSTKLYIRKKFEDTKRYELI